MANIVRHVIVIALAMARGSVGLGLLTKTNQSGTDCPPKGFTTQGGMATKFFEQKWYTQRMMVTTVTPHEDFHCVGFKHTPRDEAKNGWTHDMQYWSSTGKEGFASPKAYCSASDGRPESGKWLIGPCISNGKGGMLSADNWVVAWDRRADGGGWMLLSAGPPTKLSRHGKCRTGRKIAHSGMSIVSSEPRPNPKDMDQAMLVAHRKGIDTSILLPVIQSETRCGW